MKKFLLFVTTFLFAISARAEDAKQFPNISGTTLFMAQADRVNDSERQGVSPNNGFVYVEANLGLNFNKNWSIKTDWRLQPNNVLTTRNQTYSEKYRTFLQSGRGFDMEDQGVFIEELKLDFKNEDLNFFIGKFDPTFGTAYNKSKRIGVFTWQFAEDYNLREKLGGGFTAFLENSKVTFNNFFNDTTSLSRSAIDDRGRAQRNDGMAGNTGTLSSYSISMEGEGPFGVENLFYNLGYRSLGVDNMPNRTREKGYVVGAEYLYQLGLQTSIIPFIELVKIDNFTGERNRDAIYSTIALIGKYSSWSASISHLSRNIKTGQAGSPKVSDRQLQLSAGYKFNDNLTLDVTRANIKESGYSAVLFGVNLMYVYKF